MLVAVPASVQFKKPGFLLCLRERFGQAAHGLARGGLLLLIRTFILPVTEPTATAAIRAYLVDAGLSELPLYTVAVSDVQFGDVEAGILLFPRC